MLIPRVHFQVFILQNAPPYSVLKSFVELSVGQFLGLCDRLLDGQTDRPQVEV